MGVTTANGTTYSNLASARCLFSSLVILTALMVLLIVRPNTSAVRRQTMRREGNVVRRMAPSWVPARVAGIMIVVIP